MLRQIMSRPIAGNWLVRYRARELKPHDPPRWCAAAGVSLVSSRKFDLPPVRRELRDDKWKWRLGELHQRLIVSRCDENFTGDLRRVLVPLPHRLALVRHPILLCKIHRRQWRHASAACAKRSKNAKQSHSNV